MQESIKDDMDKKPKGLVHPGYVNFDRRVHRWSEKDDTGRELEDSSDIRVVKFGGRLLRMKKGD